MKKSLVSFLLICTFLANAQEKNTVPIQILKLDSITAIGKADGKEITKEIGKEGGKIVSEDGKMELIFPEGAISKKKKNIYSAYHKSCSKWPGKGLSHGTFGYSI